MQTLEESKRNVTDLHWLATLLTGSRETAIGVTLQALKPAGDANPAFSSWINAWSRRNVIARALAAVREDLARSARRTAAQPLEKSDIPPGSWTLDRITTKSDLERALLPIDVFPRAAVLLLVFERVPLKDAAILLDSDPDLVRRALAAGARGLTMNLACMQGCKSVACGSNTNRNDQHARSTEIPT